MGLILKRNMESISEKEWIECVNHHDELFFCSKPNGEPLIEHINVKLEGAPYGSASYSTYHNGINIDFQDRVFWRLYDLIFSMNNFLGTRIYKSNGELLSDLEIEKLLSLKKLRQFEYGERFFKWSLNSSDWLAIKTNSLNLVFETFKMENIEELNWDKGITKKDSNGGFVITPIICGWVFVAGFYIYDLLMEQKPKNGNTHKGDENYYSNCLSELSLKFDEIHSYCYYNRNTFVNSFYKAVGGKLIYGFSQSESGGGEIGEKPEDIKHLLSYDSNDIANIWSIDPGDFPFMPELENSIIYYFKNEQQEKEWMRERLPEFMRDML